MNDKQRDVNFATQQRIYDNANPDDYYALEEPDLDPSIEDMVEIDNCYYVGLLKSLTIDYKHWLDDDKFESRTFTLSPDKIKQMCIEDLKEKLLCVETLEEQRADGQ